MANSNTTNPELAHNEGVDVENNIVPFSPDTTPEPVTPEPRKLDRLAEFSINAEIDELRRHAKNATHILGRLALAGQITALFGGPNTGKTLLTLWLVSEAKANGTLGDHVYHINLDDTYEGQISKAELGNRHGFHVIVPTKFPHPSENFQEIVEELVKEGTANEAVFILDTVKKFTDVMDKKASSQFMNVCRKLTSAGGSIILLAHVNMHRDGDEQSIPAGTSDILDDCDCAYVMDIESKEKSPGGEVRAVAFRQLKSRGPVVQSAHYSYTKFDDGDYDRMFHSIKLLDGNETDCIRAEKALRCEKNGEQEMINEIHRLLDTQGETIQKELVEALTSNGKFSRRKVTACLKRWSCPTEQGGEWISKKGENNRTIYSRQ